MTSFNGLPPREPHEVIVLRFGWPMEQGQYVKTQQIHSDLWGKVSCVDNSNIFDFGFRAGKDHYLWPFSTRHIRVKHITGFLQEAKRLWLFVVPCATQRFRPRRECGGAKKAEVIWWTRGAGTVFDYSKNVAPKYASAVLITQLGSPPVHHDCFLDLRKYVIAVGSQEGTSAVEFFTRTRAQIACLRRSHLFEEERSLKLSVWRAQALWDTIATAVPIRRIGVKWSY